MNFDEKFMQRCLQLAALGLGKTSPNPMVGAVIVHDNEIIGEGFHHVCGQAHAEINAINSVKNKDLLKESTLYVNLEPCSHFGKTPPCADAIIAHRIPKVVIGTVDYHDKVNGSGIEKLKNANVEVVTNVCKSECEELNKRFFTFHQKRRPYIILKWAQTLNGFMDIDRNVSEEPYWITNDSLKVITHKWRSEEDAIVIGYNTFKNDKPQLTTREYTGKNPKRYIMLRGVEKAIPENFSVLPDDAILAVNSLYNSGVQSVIIEGGRKTLDKFIENDLWDEARILVGNVAWNSGLKAPNIPATPQNIINIDDNKLYYVRRHL